MSDAFVCDDSMRFSERTFIHMITRIMKIVIASSLPIGEGESNFLIRALITVLYINRREHQKSME